jgi:purine nucleosidase
LPPCAFRRSIAAFAATERIGDDAAGRNPAEGAMRLLIDTDPGVDDALAILMAHAQADVAGLSIAAGNVGLEHTTRNALALVERIGARTPVFPGCATPLVRAARDAGFVHGSDGFGDVDHEPPAASAQAEHAAVALLRLTAEQPGALTLVALAPLTNLALALRLDPDLPRRVRRLVVMGGAVTGRGNTERVPAEFNVGFDAEAAHVVFSAWPMIELVDWELCVRHAIAFTRFERLLETDDPRARFYAEISARTRAFNRRSGREGMIVADAIAMAVALDPAIVRQADERAVAIELNGEGTRGATVVDWDGRLGGRVNARIVREIDQDGYERMVAGALGATTVG